MIFWDGGGVFLGPRISSLEERQQNRTILCVMRFEMRPLVLLTEKVHVKHFVAGIKIPLVPRAWHKILILGVRKAKRRLGANLIRGF